MVYDRADAVSHFSVLLMYCKWLSFSSAASWARHYATKLLYSNVFFVYKWRLYFFEYLQYQWQKPLDECLLLWYNLIPPRYDNAYLRIAESDRHTAYLHFWYHKQKRYHPKQSLFLKKSIFLFCTIIIGTNMYQSSLYLSCVHNKCDLKPVSYQ